MFSATALPAKPPATAPTAAPMAVPTGPTTEPAPAPAAIAAPMPAAPPAAAPTPVPTGCEPGAPVIGSGLESLPVFVRFDSVAIMWVPFVRMLPQPLCHRGPSAERDVGKGGVRPDDGATPKAFRTLAAGGKRARVARARGRGGGGGGD